MIAPTRLLVRLPTNSSSGYILTLAFFRMWYTAFARLTAAGSNQTWGPFMYSVRYRARSTQIDFLAASSSLWSRANLGKRSILLSDIAASSPAISLPSLSFLTGCLLANAVPGVETRWVLLVGIEPP